MSRKDLFSVYSEVDYATARQVQWIAKKNPQYFHSVFCSVFLFMFLSLSSILKYLNSLFLQVERPPVQTDSPKKAEQRLPSDPEKTPFSNAPNTTDSEGEEAAQQGGNAHLSSVINH